MSDAPRPRPELLAPAGGPDQLHAALAAGADAVYAGLPRFSARARAENFSPDELACSTRLAHRAGARVYLTLNTLLRDDEWDEALEAVRTARCAGVDALIVQDLGLARLLRQRCPDLELHASTQMTVHHPGQLETLADLGLRRFILARELSMDDVGTMARAAAALGVEVEVFAHGALCVSWSGQCLAGAELDERSGNRGLCPQVCRRRFASEGPRPTHPWPLSLGDLWTVDRLPDLVAAGVSAFKLEGRLKKAEHVYAMTRVYRRALDDLAAGRPYDPAPYRRELEDCFHREYTGGGLAGELALAVTTPEGPSRMFRRLGTVVEVDPGRERVRLDRPPACDLGDRVFLYRGGPNHPLRAYVQKHFPALPDGSSWVALKVTDGRLDGAWRDASMVLMSDAGARAAVRDAFRGFDPPGFAVEVTVRGRAGEPLTATARSADGGRAAAATAAPLQPATQHPLDQATLERQLGRLGGTDYRLASLEARLEGDLFLPVSELNELRRTLVAALVESARPRPELLPPTPWPAPVPPAPVRVSVGCWTGEQARRALGLGVSRAYVPFPGRLDDWPDGEPERLWARLPAVTPGRSFDRMASSLDALRGRLGGALVGNLSGASFCRARGLPFWADTTWNLLNAEAVLTAHHLGAAGAAWSWEATRAEAAAGAARLPLSTEYVVRGEPPLLLVAVRDLASSVAWLTDERGRRLRVTAWDHAPGATVHGPPRAFTRRQLEELRPVPWLRVELSPDPTDDDWSALERLARRTPDQA